jgi:hypothetical protein
MKRLINILENFKFRRRFGFSKKQLSALYSNLVARDDQDWVEFTFKDHKIQIKNTEFWIMRPDCHQQSLSITGNYADGKNNGIYQRVVTGIGEHTWKELLIVNHWHLYHKGEWVWAVQLLLEYYDL